MLLFETIFLVIMALMVLIIATGGFVVLMLYCIECGIDEVRLIQRKIYGEERNDVRGDI
jgi:hypothetical protein